MEGMNMSSMDMKNMSDMDMMMYLHTDVGMDTILFKSWKPTSGYQLFYACLVTFLVTFGYEGLKYLRQVLHYRQIKEPNYGHSVRAQLVNRIHAVQTILHVVQYTLSYALMLVVMTFQVYLYLAVVLGAGVGFLFFNPLVAKLKSNYGNYEDICC